MAANRVDHIHEPGAPPQHLPHSVPQANPRHHMAGSYPLQRHIGPCQDPQHVFTAETSSMDNSQVARGLWDAQPSDSRT